MVMTIIGKEGCPACVRAKEEAYSREIPFHYLTVGKDITLEELKARWPSVRTVPVVMYRDREFLNTPVGEVFAEIDTAG